MCFILADKQERWENKTVWKILRIRGESLESLHGMGRKLNWWANTWVKAEGSPNPRAGGFLGTPLFRSAGGIYVYKSEVSAGNRCRFYYNAVLIRLKVDPEDFLHHDRYNEIATYRKVYLDEDQPFVDFS